MHFVPPNRVCIEFRINCTPLMPVEIAALLVFLKFLEKIVKQTVFIYLIYIPLIFTDVELVTYS